MSVLMVESELQKLVPIFGCGNSQEGALFTSATDRKAGFVSLSKNQCCSTEAIRTTVTLGSILLFIKQSNRRESPG